MHSVLPDRAHVATAGKVTPGAASASFPERGKDMARSEDTLSDGMSALVTGGSRGSVY